MENDNDFEKYEGYTDSVETLLGTNEKSSSMTSRERTDDAIEGAAAEYVSSSTGLSKGIAKKIVKEDGGKLAPTHGPTQKIAKEYSRNKIADVIDKVEGNDDKYSKADSGKDAYERTLKNGNDYYDKQREMAQKRKDDARTQSDNAKNNKDSSIERLQKLKERNKNIPRNQRTDEQKEELKNAKKENKEAKEQAKNTKNEEKKSKRELNLIKRDKAKAKVYQTLHPVQALAMKTKMLILKALMPVIGYFILFFLAILVILIIVVQVRDAIENTIDEYAEAGQKIDNFMFGYGFKDTQQAFYDELSDLCDKYVCTNDGSGLNAPLLLSTIFYTETSGYGDTDFSKIDDDIDSDEDDTFSFNIIDEYIEKRTTKVGSDGIPYTRGQIKRLKRLAKHQVSKSSGGSYVFDEDGYKTYLFDKYFENTNEFEELLGGLSGEDRTKRKEQIYSEIVDNANLYEEIYMGNMNLSSESYTENCVGAIDSELVSELKMPVDIKDSSSITFDDEYAYGIVNGKDHNGVDLNEKTVGVTLGSDVFSVETGKVASISDSKCSNGKKCGKSIKISHDISIDNKSFKFFTIYSNVTPIKGLAADKKIGKGDKIGTIYKGSDNTEGLHFAFMDANTDSNGTLIDPTNLFIPCKRGSSNLVGDTTEEKVWNYFLAKGYNKFKIAAIMGNIYSESGFKSNNLENSCNIVYTDEAFTEAVNNGTIKKDEFMQSTRICTHYGDGRYGYGLAQWTDPGLKGAFYDKKVEYNVGIDDEGLQLDLLYEELEGNWNYPNHKNTWESASSESDIYTATEAYCNGFEVGTGCSSRGDAAMKYYNQFKNK